MSEQQQKHFNAIARNIRAVMERRSQWAQAVEDTYKILDERCITLNSLKLQGIDVRIEKADFSGGPGIKVVLHSPTKYRDLDKGERSMLGAELWAVIAVNGLATVFFLSEIRDTRDSPHVPWIETRHAEHEFACEPAVLKDRIDEYFEEFLSRAVDKHWSAVKK